MELRTAIEVHHDELHKMLKDSGSKTLDGMTIVTVNEKPTGQMVIAPPDWTNEQIVSRLQACIDGIQSRDMVDRRTQ